MSVKDIHPYYTRSSKKNYFCLGLMLKNIVKPTVCGSVLQNIGILYQNVYESYQLLKHLSSR